MCADINPSSLERARGYGADAIVNTKEQDLKQAVQEFTNGAGVDVKMCIRDRTWPPRASSSISKRSIRIHKSTGALPSLWEAARFFCASSA